MRSTAVIAIVALASLLWTGCATVPSITPTGIEEFEVTFSMPAADLYEIVQRAIGEFGLAIDSSGGGTIETTWERHAGSEHGILLWRRRWQARTRYILRVAPDFSLPNSHSVLSVNYVSEERPNDNYPWEETDLLDYGSERIATLLRIIERLSEK